MAQKAVDWLANELKSKGHALITSEGIFINVPNELIEQAKSMERAQIIDGYNSGYQDGCDRKDDTSGSIYYNQTFQI